MNKNHSPYFTYFYGSSLSFIAFLLIVLLFPLALKDFDDLWFSYFLVTFWGIPFVYVTTLIAYGSYFVVKRFNPSWKLSLHLFISALSIAVLFAIGFSEDSVFSPLLVAIIGGAAAFLLGTKAKKSAGSYVVTLIPVLHLAGVVLVSVIFN
ncbi:hypothetical protein ACFQPF_06760 [Fictibacillus iocasae]|uniref:Uncharacterized protein n=1 Tax=Fictibacillus iocasae TaxID=2715437 RepID=A0ABW2NPN6_9BACL